MFSPARHHFGELQLAAPEREVLVWSGSPRDPREGRDEWSVLAWSPSPVKSRENGVRGQRDLPSARGVAELRPPCSAVQDATTDDTAPAASGASQAADPDRRSPRNPQLLPVPSSDSAREGRRGVAGQRCPSVTSPPARNEKSRPMQGTGHWQTLLVRAGLDHPRTGGR